ncbi:MAG: MarR family winged helix-turn-helix transcriptional regulator [Caulobacteraceae bacterium]
MSDEADALPFATPDYVLHVMVALNRYRDLRMDVVLKDIGLNVARYRALAAVARFEPCAMTYLADSTIADRTTMTRTVDQLVDGGLVLRERGERDRREVIVRLTNEGRALITMAADLVFALNRDLLKGITERRQREFIRFAHDLAENLEPDADARARAFNMRPDGRSV